MQGTLPNCSFIASLVSLLWTKSALEYSVVPESVESDSVRHAFVLFDAAAKKICLETDERLAFFTGATCFSTSRVHGQVWPGLWEKVFMCRETGQTTDTPDPGSVARGVPSEALLALSGKRARVLDAERFLGELRHGGVADGKCRAPAVGGTSASSHWLPNVNLAANHAYSILGLVRFRDVPHVIVNNPSGRRDVRHGRLPWEVLEAFSWIKPFASSIRGNDSGVLPLPEELFIRAFDYIDVVTADDNAL